MISLDKVTKWHVIAKKSISLLKSLILCIILSMIFLDGAESAVEFDFDSKASVLTLHKPGINAGADWTVTLQ